MRHLHTQTIRVNRRVLRRWPLVAGTGLAMVLVVGLLIPWFLLPPASPEIAARAQDAPSAQDASGWTPTPSGPIGPADRKLLTKVRQANLWEAPTAQQAQQQASTQRVKDVGMTLMNDHVQLDQQLHALASELNVALPDQPSDEQRGWMAELAGKNGPDYDRTWANRLRGAHGQIFTLASQVRAGTRNSQMRGFADFAVALVAKHMRLLESTNFVDFSALPPPMTPPSTVALVPSPRQPAGSP